MIGKLRGFKVPLRVEYGSIYNLNDEIIENMAVIIDTEVGLMKFGDSSWVESHYSKMVEKFRSIGFEERVENLILVTFDKYEGTLNTDEICTFVNYMIMASGNVETIMRMLSMETDLLKSEIVKLKEYGY